MSQPSHNNRAALMIVSAMAIIGTVDAFVAAIGEAIGIWQFLVLRAFFLTPIILLVLVPMGFGRLYVKSWKAVLARSFLVGTGLSLYFAALGVFPLAQAFAGLYAAPIFIVIISLVVLREWVGWVRSLAAILGFGGILIVLEFDFAAVNVTLFIPMIAGVLYGSGHIITGRYCRGESTSVLMLGLTFVHLMWGLLGLILLSVLPVESAQNVPPFLLREWTWSFSEVLPEICVQMFGSVVIMLLVTSAYKTGETSFVSIFENTVFIFGPLFAYFYFGQALSAVQIGGIVMIAAAGVIISLWRNRQERRAAEAAPL